MVSQHSRLYITINTILMPNAGKTISAEPTPIAPPPTARTQTQAVQAELPPDSGSVGYEPFRIETAVG